MKQVGIYDRMREELKKLSVQELVLGDSPIKIKFTTANGKLYATLFDHKAIGGIALDSSQAHLLYLYLKERFEK